MICDFLFFCSASRRLSSNTHRTSRFREKSAAEVWFGDAGVSSHFYPYLIWKNDKNNIFCLCKPGLPNHGCHGISFYFSNCYWGLFHGNDSRCQNLEEVKRYSFPRRIERNGQRIAITFAISSPWNEKRCLNCLMMNEVITFSYIIYQNISRIQILIFFTSVRMRFRHLIYHPQCNKIFHTELWEV